MLRGLVSCTLAAALTTACAAQERTANDATEVGVPPAPASSAAPREAAADASTTPSSGTGCAPTFAQAHDARCTIGDAPCTYPEGSCDCGDFPHCGGAAARPATRGEPGQRYCTARDPRWLRADGCTDGTPADGTRCTKAGQVCTYGPCSWSAITASCRDGTWHVTQDRGPPPP